MNRQIRLVVTVGLSLGVFSNLHAQSHAASAFVEQFAALKVSVEKLYDEVTKGESAAASRIAQYSRANALLKLSHRLEEEAGQEDLTSRKDGARTDKRLRLVQQGCKTLDYLLFSITSFIDTDDHDFVRLGADAKQVLARIADLASSDQLRPSKRQ